MIKELRERELIVELPASGGTTRRYVVSNKGRAELEKLRNAAEKETRKQLELLAYYCDQSGRRKLGATLRAIAASEP